MTKKSEIEDILRDIRRDWGTFDVEAETEAEWNTLRQDLLQLIQEYNQEADTYDDVPYQWTIDAFISTRRGDEYMGSYQRLLQLCEHRISEVDTHQRLTDKPTIWRYRTEERGKRIRQTARNYKGQGHPIINQMKNGRKDTNNP